MSSRLLGDLRWQAPQSPPKVSGVQQAAAQPRACLQASVGNSSTNPFLSNTTQKRSNAAAGEDCLFLKCAISACYVRISLTSMYFILQRCRSWGYPKIKGPARLDLDTRWRVRVFP